MSIYDFTVKDANKDDISLSSYKNKVLLIVNTAIKCGLTSQYKEFQALYKKYKNKGFEILDFPCNQFFEQSPGSEEEIIKFCHTNYGVTFKIFSKIEVNGENAHPLFVYLTQNAPCETEDEKAEEFKRRLLEFEQYFTKTSIKWNFTKFLIDREGNINSRFSPTFSPSSIKPYIEKLI